MVANPVRGLLDRKRSEEHLPSSNESKERHKNTDDKEKGTGITKYTGQRKINERHSIERVWHSSLHWAIVKPARWLSWQASGAAPSHSDFFFSSFISLTADGPHHYHPACGHKGSSHLSPIHALQLFIAMQVWHSYLQLVNQWLNFVKGKIKSRLLQQLTAVFLEREDRWQRLR